jgi:hypothetical protein
MRKFLLCLILIALVSSIEIIKRPPSQLTDEEKKKLIRDAVNELVEKLASGEVDEVIRWIKIVGCAVGPVACEIAFPEFAWACAIGFGIVCAM